MDRVVVYCPKTDIEQWDEEVEENGVRSRSTYLYELIQEARAYRNEGFLSHHQAENRIEELEAEVQKLHRELKENNSHRGKSSRLDDVEFLQQFLKPEYQPLEELLKRVVASGAVDRQLRRPIENQLYYLAEQNIAEYERGHGWRLTQKGGEN
ncbi:hypothetical protein C454_11186 [Haloferax gibbonsii ATCC 33959]|uniref:CopG family transcriptional regulator n=2 Tax=Haloferax gibbonsii TaxID=35746 RepID=M0H6M8_HALGM|nr:hypothetical protein C454_11186 [Haloferax gibbonsii ATCC 33959]